MNILVTGANGFIGKNLCVYLERMDDVKVIPFDKDETLSDLKKFVKKADFIFHLAGVNRPDDNKQFYEGNFDLTKSLVDILNEYKKDIPLIISSSIQAELDNDYGKSKKQAEDYMRDNYSKSIIFRLHNVFGKWCRPNYNSVVATFCYNIAHGLDITVNDPNKELELVYIDDICETFGRAVLDISTVSYNDINYIKERKVISLGELSELIYSFRDDMKSIYVPKTGDSFVKKLFATYVSYLPLDDMVHTPVQHIDQRGGFCELVRTLDSGQFSVSFSKPGIFRGNHYHHTKMERFIVIKGKAKITFRHILTNEMKEYYVSGDELQIVTIPVGYTHKIENIGEDEMILFLWCNELFDEKHPDTYFEEVENGKVKSNGRSRNKARNN